MNGAFGTHPQSLLSVMQLSHVMSDYGSFDILWLDGGWVKGDDIGLDDILAQARRKHPGLISVDRSIRGKNENYQTPERGIPETQLNYPWITF